MDQPDIQALRLKSVKKRGFESLHVGRYPILVPNYNDPFIGSQKYPWVHSKMHKETVKLLFLF